MRTFLLIFFTFFLVIRSIAQIDSAVNVDTITTTAKEQSNWLKSTYVKQSIVPVSLALGSFTIMAIPNFRENLQSKLNWNNQNSPDYINHSPDYINLGDDYVRYAPAVAAYALSACGLKSQHRFIDRSAILAVAYIASDFVVNNTKKNYERAPS